jgi:ribosomal protein L11 methylase PrmA
VEGFVKTTGVTQVTVVTSAEAEEPVSALMERLFGVWPSIYGNVETGVSAASIFSRAKPAEIRGALPELRDGLRDLEEFGIRIAPGEIKVARVKREDWSESWKKYFKTIEIGEKLMIKPSWSKQKAKVGQAVVVVDPGLSFGTGQHATTSFCLREVVKQSGGPKKALLDIGCGSGILAIAAAKLKFGKKIARATG